MQSIRIYEMPVCKMVSSGTGMFGAENFNRFEAWFSSQKRACFQEISCIGQATALYGCICMKMAWRFRRNLKS